MKVLVTGGAGYVGSVIVEALVHEGHQVIVIDNLQQGHRIAVMPQAEFCKVDIGDRDALMKVFACRKIDAVMHFAAYSCVGESMIKPTEYFRNNVASGINLLNTMIKHKVLTLVFSSSASIYGEPKGLTIDEGTLQNPDSPYGESKLIFEKMLRWYYHAYGLRSISLRYFNAAGASLCFGEDHNPETHLIPNVLRVAMGKMEKLNLFGNDYPTKDGGCVRDYVHVLDIAQAHIIALEHLDHNQLCKAYNLGNGEGYSVLEVIETASRVCGTKIPFEVNSRRPGDPATLIANHALIKNDLGWTPKFSSLESMINSAWQWHHKFPNGY